MGPLPHDPKEVTHVGAFLDVVGQVEVDVVEVIAAFVVPLRQEQSGNHEQSNE
jgi:hypothetical protein